MLSLLVATSLGLQLSTPPTARRPSPEAVALMREHDTPLLCAERQ